MLHILKFCIMVDLIASDVLLSKGKMTFSSKTLHSNTNSANLVDGNYNGSFYSNSCYHSTTKNTDKWWIVVLSQLNPVVITRFRVFFRTDCCIERTVNITFYISSTSKNSFQYNDTDFRQLTTYNGPPSSATKFFEISLNPSIGITFALSKPYDEDVLNICEVEVYGIEISYPKPMRYIKVFSSGIKQNVIAFLNIQNITLENCANTCWRGYCTSFSYDYTLGTCSLYSESGGDFISHY